MSKIKVEVCAESIESALVAQECGAARIEFCDNMAEGGTTPSAGSIRILRDNLSIQLFPIIRPRGGDFAYTDTEFEVMKADIRFCGETGCDGIVTGILTPEGYVDTDRCSELVALAKEFGMETTFHRAFDVSHKLRVSLEAIISLGFDRILTSGGLETAEEGMKVIKKLNTQADGRIIIMPGSGVTPGNAVKILEETGCLEIHGTFRSYHKNMPEEPAWADFGRWATDPEKVRKVVADVADMDN